MKEAKETILNSPTPTSNLTTNTNQIFKINGNLHGATYPEQTSFNK